MIGLLNILLCFSRKEVFFLNKYHNVIYKIIEYRYWKWGFFSLNILQASVFLFCDVNVSLTDTFITKLSFLSNHISSKLPDPQSGNFIILVQGVVMHVFSANVVLSLLLGYTNCYRRTGNENYISTVESRDYITGEQSKEEEKQINGRQKNTI